DIDCKTVDSALSPCIPYLLGGGTPTTDCCKGVSAIKDMSTTTDNKRNACKCVKTAAARYPSLKDEVAQALPDKCQVKLDIPISRNTNCDAI
uniref:Non-specific lipid-transfer protein 1 n=1 Tax=Carum carvi TaxID=48032 RepID=NLTP1_CARCB|nr:RecName: Full=Non-specific lipid-transfer protein 1; Short=LTP1; Short=nsLTP1 [Carum carvi]